jgi:hypothetical protein
LYFCRLLEHKVLRSMKDRHDIFVVGRL